MGDCARVVGGVSEELMLPLSVGREVVTHARDIEAVSSFNVWQNGERVVYFDPLLRDPVPTVWEPRMREAGIDPKAEGPLPDGLFHMLEASFAMAANYTGALFTPEFLSATTFLMGSAN